MLNFLSKSFSNHINLGIDDLLSRHIAHLFIRDPLVVFSESIDQDDTTSMDHFEVRDVLKCLAMHTYSCY